MRLWHKVGTPEFERLVASRKFDGTPAWLRMNGDKPIIGRMMLTRYDGGCFEVAFSSGEHLGPPVISLLTETGKVHDETCYIKTIDDPGVPTE